MTKEEALQALNVLHYALNDARWFIEKIQANLQPGVTAIEFDVAETAQVVFLVNFTEVKADGTRSPLQIKFPLNPARRAQLIEMLKV